MEEREILVSVVSILFLGFNSVFLFQFGFQLNHKNQIENQNQNWNASSTQICVDFVPGKNWTTKPQLKPNTTIEPQILWKFVFHCQFGISISIMVFGFNFHFHDFPSLQYSCNLILQKDERN
jgi:hypothetical protein